VYGSSLTSSSVSHDLDLLWVGESSSFQGELRYLELFARAFPPTVRVDAIYICVDELVRAAGNALHPYVVQALCLQTYAEHLWGEDIRSHIPLLSNETVAQLRSWDCFRYWRYYLRGGRLRALRGMLHGLAVVDGELPLALARQRSDLHLQLSLSPGSWGRLYRAVNEKGDLTASQRVEVLARLLELAETTQWGEGIVLPPNWGKWSVNGELGALLLTTEKDEWNCQVDVKIAGFPERLKRMILNDG
jgi:hypothetical protein